MQRSHRPQIDALVSFEAAARHGSVSRAAAELHLTQGAISRQIQKLEQQLGVTLFRRVRQRIVLTEAGNAYLADVRRIIADLDRATERLGIFAGAANRLNVAVQPTVATFWLIPRLPGFLRKHPEIDLNLTVCPELSAAEAEPYDLAIQHGNAEIPSFDAELLFENRVMPVCSPEFARANGLGCEADLLRVKRMHQKTRPEDWSRWFDHVGIDAGAQARQGIWLERIPMIVQATVSGIGVALLPEFLIEPELKSGTLIVVSPHREVVSEGYFLLRAAGSQEKGGAFVAWLRDEARKGVGTRPVTRAKVRARG